MSVQRRLFLPGVLVGAALFATHAAAAPSKATTLKEVADYALAESGATLAPAWSAGDETVSRKAKAVASEVVKDPAVKDAESDSVLKGACGLKDDPVVARSMHMLNAASIARTRLNPTNKAETSESRKVTMVTLNRVEAYADGYTAGAKSLIGLIFAMSPEVRSKLCGMVKSQVSQ